MRYESISSTGVNHTLPHTPVDSDLVFPVLNRHVLQRVSISPGNSEFTLSGLALVTGLSVTANDDFGVFIAVSPSTMLVHEIPSGAIDGLNKVFTIATTIPANSESLVVHNTMVPQPLGVDYTRTGQNFTFESGYYPPQPGDSIFVLVEAPKITNAVFTKKAITLGQGAFDPNFFDPEFFVTTNLSLQNGKNRFFAIQQSQVVDFDHIVLMNQSSRLLEPTFSPELGIPESGTHFYDQVDGILEVGVAPEETDSLVVHIVGLQTAWTSPFLEELKRGTPLIFLAEIGLVDAAAVPSVHYAATHAYATRDFDTPMSQAFKGHMVRVPRITRQLNFDGHSVTSFSDVELFNQVDPASQVFGASPIGTEPLPSYLLDQTFGQHGLHTFGQPIVIDATFDRDFFAYADRRRVLTGIGRGMHTADTRSGIITIPLSDTSRILQQTCELEEITTAEFPNADESTLGQYKPEVWGFVYRLKPKLVDQATRTYLVSSRAVTITAVYDNEFPVAFQVGPNGDRFTLLADPVGEITCDVRGSDLVDGSGFSARISRVLEDYLVRKAGFTASNFHAGALRLWKQEAPWAVGYAISEPTAHYQVLDDILRGIPSSYFFTFDGKFVFMLQKSTEGMRPRANFYGDRTSTQRGPRMTQHEPVWRTALGYQKLETVQSQIFSTATQAQRQFATTPYRIATHMENFTKQRFALAIDEGGTNPDGSPKFIPTRLVNKTDAEEVCGLRLDLRKVPRSELHETFDRRALALDIGDTFIYRSSRYQIGDANPIWLVTAWGGTFGGRDTQVEITAWQ